MGLSIRYNLPKGMTSVKEPVDWCNSQGWKHIIEWRWFWNNPATEPTKSAQFHFENPDHGVWFILRWGGTITGQI
jgi:hypothetical protein